MVKLGIGLRNAGVECTVMGRAVFAYQTCTVETKYHIQVVNSHIMY